MNWVVPPKPQPPAMSASERSSLVSVAAALDLDGHNIRSARLAMGGVAHKPWRLSSSEQALVGVDIGDADKLRTAIVRGFADARPLEQNELKLNSPNALSCVLCKLREHGHERHRKTLIAR